MQIIILESVNIVIILCLCRLFRLGIVNYRKRIKKQLSYYKLLLNWNLCDARNEKLVAHLLECGYKNIMIYGAGDLGKIFYHKINTNVNVCAFIEKNPKTEKVYNIPILSCKDVKLQRSKIDCIIVTPIFEFEPIQRELMKEDNKVPIIPLDTLIRDL